MPAPRQKPKQMLVLEGGPTWITFQLLRSWLKALALRNLASERATRGASVSVGASGRARSVPTCLTCSSPNSCPSY